MKKIFIFLFLIATSNLFAQEIAKPVPLTDSLYRSLSPTPAMGWNSWNTFGCNVSEKLIMEMADAIVELGMKEAGYEYVVIDDCWQVDRDLQGDIVCDPERFPHGMKYLADYVHDKGLKFGLYSCAGDKTCEGRPGSEGHEYQDALKYAEWGVDFLKLDWCYNNGQFAPAAYRTMAEAIKATGHPIVLNICEWGHNKPWKWGEGIGHSWRVSADITDCFDCVVEYEGWTAANIVNIIDIMAELYPFAGPGHWNDAEMMVIGVGDKMNKIENISHFSMWSMFAAPLFAGNDLRRLYEDKETHEVLTNKEVIAINQDPLGYQARKFMDEGDQEVWVKQLADGDLALCFLNRSFEVWNLNYDWYSYEIEFIDKALFHKNIYSVRDLWTHRNLGKTNKNLKAKIPAHGCLMLRLSR